MLRISTIYQAFILNLKIAMPNMNNIKIGKTLRQTRHSRLVRYNIT
jgi:hypothetical protein